MERKEPMKINVDLPPPSIDVLLAAETERATLALESARRTIEDLLHSLYSAGVSIELLPSRMPGGELWILRYRGKVSQQGYALQFVFAGEVRRKLLEEAP